MTETDPNKPFALKRVDLWYPTLHDACCVDVIEVQLICVRAARGIRVHYDFERDGYVISAQHHNPDEPWVDPGPYTERAFIPAWDEFPGYLCSSTTELCNYDDSLSTG